MCSDRKLSARVTCFLFLNIFLLLKLVLDVATIMICVTMISWKKDCVAHGACITLVMTGGAMTELEHVVSNDIYLTYENYPKRKILQID